MRFALLTRRSIFFGFLIALAAMLLQTSCRTGNTNPLESSPATHQTQGHPASCLCPQHKAAVGLWTDWPTSPTKNASPAFWKFWGDGRAELTSYQASISRYGQQRKAELVLIYVTEPMNRKTWIKDDDASEPERVSVLKLHASLKFLTGLYPYSVSTSVFSPVDDWQRERFTPAKLSISVQEWCGHVYASVWPSRDRYLYQVNSYFASEGEHRIIVPVSTHHLYEDALLIQLRELDGPFQAGKDWKGSMIPELWQNRKAHIPLNPRPATITRQLIQRAGQDINQFTLTYTDTQWTRMFEVENNGERRLLGWKTSDGEVVSLHKSLRLPYWQLNNNADLHYRKKLGL